MGTRTSTIALCFGLFAAGCTLSTGSSDGSDRPGPITNAPPQSVGGEGTVTPAPGKALARVVHAAPDAPRVDVYVKGVAKPVLTGLAYGETSMWIEVDPGAYAFEVRVSPSTAADPAVFTTGELAVPAGAKLSAVAAGLVGAKDAASAFRVLPVVETFAKAEAGYARIRAIHAGADAPAVDLDVGADDPSAPEIPALARFTTTAGEGAKLPAGKALRVGIAKDGGRVTSFTTPALPDGGEVLVIATGLLAGAAKDRDGFALLAVGPRGSIGFIKQDPIVYALHAGPDAPAVDGFVGDVELFDDLSFGELSSPIQVPPGAYDIDLFAHAAGSARPQGSPALRQSSGALEAGERYLVAATGLLAAGAAQPLRLAAYRDDFARGGSDPRLRAVHASPDAPKVDIGLAPHGAINPVIFAGLSFGQASDGSGFEAPATTLPVGVAPAGQLSSVVARFSVPAASEQRAFVLAAGTLTHQTARSFRFLVVDTAATPWTVATVLPH